MTQKEREGIGKDEAYYWFLLGFEQSREGYNGECAYRHLKPRRAAHKDYWELVGRFNEVDVSDLFQELWEKDGGEA